jgi:metallo-beta-lactamase family protein
MDYPDAKETVIAGQSEAIAKAKRPYIVVASNGMLTGGRVLNHLRNLIGDTKAMILFVGYQGEATLGAHLQSGVKTARIDGQEFVVRCGVRSITGFSAHADETGLLSWLGNFIAGRKEGDSGVPRRIFVVHGDPDAQAILQPKIEALGLPAMAPHWHETVILD